VRPLRLGLPKDGCTTMCWQSRSATNWRSPIFLIPCEAGALNTS
jgi:hypothetical protein